MKQTAAEKLPIFLIMFLISLIASIESPVFTPFASGFGATSVLIGMMLSFGSLADLVGNLLAGPLVDRFGKKLFIIFPLFVSGGLFIAHGLVSNSSELFLLHGLNEFAMAFLIPAAFTLLSGYAKNRRQQGKNMAINGILTTIASIMAPVIGGQMVVWIGYVNTYYFIGSAMLLTSIYGMTFLKERDFIVKEPRGTQVSLMKIFTSQELKLIYLIGFAVMYIHGVIAYEIPYLTVERGVSTLNTGQLFSFMGLGTFLALSLFFINRFDPFKRFMTGLAGMNASLFLLFGLSFALPVSLFFVGFFFGLVMPAIATAITESVSAKYHGRAFGVMSAVYSLGIIISSFVTGFIRDIISPYFIAFVVGMIILMFVGYSKLSMAPAIRKKTS
ncbi:MFS transporter [Salinibacillus aidingensis]|uniref:MFS transporter n=1 Tax=Salinibacillus aidingensis TaxID=237684 RepID=A0ABP3LFT4_9BACI